MPNNDDALIDLQTRKRPDSGSSESDPGSDRRSRSAALLFALVAVFIAAFSLIAAVRGRPVGTPIVVMVGYTFLFALLVFKSRVPWDRLTRGKFLLEHCLALAIVYGIATGALAAKPHLPTWFTTYQGKGGSFFDWCLWVLLFVVAICEFSWGLRVEGEGITVSWGMRGIRK